ncbi:hypothetical protein ABW22_15360 [Thiobacillus denitrificans]|uniref:Uncharacterized protein n=1 Tax=Thiobacillus denitrificans TaxID=36861 RepID=A0A119CU09_THIDE|nr:hypothetical protein ABW22_15360 [Thiobacillus denitrificans]
MGITLILGVKRFHSRNQNFGAALGEPVVQGIEEKNEGDSRQVNTEVSQTLRTNGYKFAKERAWQPDKQKAEANQDSYDTLVQPERIDYD